MDELLSQFGSYEKCMEFRSRLVNENQDWETYWKDAGGRIIRESEYDDFVGTKDNFATIQFADMIGSDGYSDSEHVFKFVVFIYEDGIENGFTMHDTIETAVKDYIKTLKLIKKQED